MLSALQSLFNCPDSPFWLCNQVKQLTWTTSCSSELMNSTFVYYTNILRIEPFVLHNYFGRESNHMIYLPCPLTLTVYSKMHISHSNKNGSNAILEQQVQPL